MWLGLSVYGFGLGFAFGLLDCWFRIACLHVFASVWGSLAWVDFICLLKVLVFGFGLFVGVCVFRDYLIGCIVFFGLLAFTFILTCG